VGALQQLFEIYGGQAAFYLVYIREAHPSDGWQVPNNEQAGVEIPDPQTQAARNDVAASACDLLNTTWPALVDAMDNAVSEAWSAWPDRIFVIDARGYIAVQAKHGPFGFPLGVEAVGEWLAANLA
jgi:hypothetical protein